MKRTCAWLRCLCFACFALALSSSLYADDPFVGKWKIDQSRSHVAGSGESVIAAGPNTWKFESAGFSWTVKADSTPQPTPFGTTAMKVVSPTIWEFTYTTKNKPSGTETWRLAPDSRSMTCTFSDKRQNGEPISSVATMKRIGGTSGFEGKWESTEVQMTFTEVDIAPNGDDGISLLVPEDGTRYSLKFDGKEYPEEGSRIPDGTTVSAKKTGERKVEAATKLNGKIVDLEVWEVSPDGKTFTYTARYPGDDQPMVIILHRLSE